MTAAGENKNGKGDGWQPTGSANEYQLAEIFSNDTGNIRVQGLPYGTYLVVETTVPHDLFQAEPFIVTVDPEQDNNPWGAMATPKDSVMTGSDSYQKFTVLDEEIEVYLRITKVDEETGKPVLLPDTAFQIYWLDEQGHYRYDSNGNPKLVTMTDTVNGHLTKDVDTFYTNSEGILTLPEKLPLGKYRIVEVTGPNGFYNEWLDSAGYENGILADDADGIYYVDFEITTDRIYAATGDKNENGMDTLVIGENYSNHETLGKLTIRKTGEVLAGWKTEVGALDPWMTGEAEDGNFVYETRPLAGAEYTITAAEDIYTLDGTLRASKGEVVDTITTGKDGTAKSKELYLGKYEVKEVTAPFGFVLNEEIHAVELVYAGQKIAVTETATGFVNERQRVEIDLVKSLETDEAYGVGNNGEIFDVTFGLYAAEELTAADGKTIPADGLIEVIFLNENGHGKAISDLPIGSYYVQEIKTNAAYLTSDTKYPVNFKYAGQETATVHITANEGNAIENKLIYSSVSGKKSDEDGKALGGAVIGIFKVGTTEFTKENAIKTTTSADDGSFSFAKVPYGTWAIREIESPKGFVLSEEEIPVTIGKVDEVVEIELVNFYITGKIELTKVDEDYPENKLTGAVFEVYADKNGDGKLDKDDELLGTMGEVEKGVYQMGDLRYGKYLVREKTAPEGFVLDEGVYGVWTKKNAPMGAMKS